MSEGANRDFLKFFGGGKCCTLALLALLALLWPISGRQSHFQGGEVPPLPPLKKSLCWLRCFFTWTCVIKNQLQIKSTFMQWLCIYVRVVKFSPSPPLPRGKLEESRHPLAKGSGQKSHHHNHLPGLPPLKMSAMSLKMKSGNLLVSVIIFSLTEWICNHDYFSNNCVVLTNMF